MNIDLHTHAKWSKHIKFSYPYFMSMMEAAHNNQLDAIALTEHFNTFQFKDIYDTLDRHCHYQSDYYQAGEIKVFPGMEVDVHEGGHILLIGAREAVVSVHSRLANHMDEKHYIRTEELLRLGVEYSCLCIGAHPFRDANPLHQTKPELLAKLDAFDLNGRDLHHYGLGMEARVCEFSEHIGLPVVAGSDTHQPLQFGSIYNHFKQSCDTIEQLRDVMQQGAYEYRISNDLHSKVQQAEAEQLKYKQGLTVGANNLLNKGG